MPVQTVIKVRRDTAANWISTNPVLAAGEMGLETDTDLFKFGNGTATWTALAYSSSSRTTQIAKNDTGASAAKGSVVYISGANGSNALFSLADADTELTSSKTVGLLAQTLATNGIGAIVTEGLLSGVNTGSATAGQSVWLSSTAGGFVFNAPPAKPAHSVYLGVVTRAHSTQGEILVKVQNGYELNELHDVNISSPQPGDSLIYDDVSGMWVNGGGGGGLTVSETAPADPAEGDMWFASAEAKTYVYYDSAWVEMSPAVQGPTGPTGATGADGATGATGASGVISVTSPIVNSGTSTSAALSLNQALLALSTSQVTQAISDKTANYSIVSGDVGKLIRSTNSAITITIDNVLTAGQRIDFAQYGSGQITFAAGSGVTINSADNNLKTAKQYAGATVECVASGIYWLVGNLGA